MHGWLCRQHEETFCKLFQSLVANLHTHIVYKQKKCVNDHNSVPAIIIFMSKKCFLMAYLIHQTQLASLAIITSLLINFREVCLFLYSVQQDVREMWQAGYMTVYCL